ncbi:Uncharacterised protein [Mycobacteroides abscessus subsp. massiliense]|nr:Uncharacterised protein [Mycobacteroides abscessus subsp. massiliense]
MPQLTSVGDHMGAAGSIIGPVGLGAAVVVDEPSTVIFRRWWAGTPASAIQVNPLWGGSCRRRCS